MLLIENLLSDYEIEHIVAMGEKVVRQSMVGSGGGGFQSKTRTSENGWLKRSQSKVRVDLSLCIVIYRSLGAQHCLLPFRGCASDD